MRWESALGFSASVVKQQQQQQQQQQTKHYTIYLVNDVFQVF